MDTISVRFSFQNIKRLKSYTKLVLDFCTEHDHVKGHGVLRPHILVANVLVKIRRCICIFHIHICLY